jgi:hypothetical protein
MPALGLELCVSFFVHFDELREIFKVEFDIMEYNKDLLYRANWQTFRYRMRLKDDSLAQIVD